MNRLISKKAAIYHSQLGKEVRVGAGLLAGNMEKTAEFYSKAI